VAKVQGEVGGQGFRAMAKVPEMNGLYRWPSFCNQSSVSRLKGKEVANTTCQGKIYVEYKIVLTVCLP
jgi:hypothetical protein